MVFSRICHFLHLLGLNQLASHGSHRAGSTELGLSWWRIYCTTQLMDVYGTGESDDSPTELDVLGQNLSIFSMAILIVRIEWSTMDHGIFRAFPKLFKTSWIFRPDLGMWAGSLLLGAGSEQPNHLWRWNLPLCGSVETRPWRFGLCWGNHFETMLFSCFVRPEFIGPDLQILQPSSMGQNIYNVNPGLINPSVSLRGYHLSIRLWLLEE